MNSCININDNAFLELASQTNKSKYTLLFDVNNWMEQNEGFPTIVDLYGELPTYRSLINQNVSGEITLTEDTHIYELNGEPLNGPNGEYQSTSEYLGHSIPEYKMNNLTRTALAVGNLFDDLGKDFFEGRVINKSLYEPYFKDSTAIDTTLNDMQAIKSHFEKKGYTEWNAGIKAYGNLDGNKVVGEMDILVRNPTTNKYAIIDIKSNKIGKYITKDGLIKRSKGVETYAFIKFDFGDGEQARPKILKYTLQQSAYRKLLIQNYGIKSEDLDVYLYNIEVDYEAQSNPKENLTINNVQTARTIPFVKIANGVGRKVSVNGRLIKVIPQDRLLYEKEVDLKDEENKIEDLIINLQSEKVEDSIYVSKNSQEENIFNC